MPSATRLGRRRDAGDDRRKRRRGQLRVQVAELERARVRRERSELAVRGRDAVEQEDARVVVIDSLNGYYNAMPEETFVALQLHELLLYLAQRGAFTVMTVAQHGLVGGEAEAPVDLSYLADAVLLFRYFETSGQVRKAITVVKKRSGRHEGFIRELILGEHGIRVGAVLERFRGVLSGNPEYLDLTGRDGASQEG